MSGVALSLAGVVCAGRRAGAEPAALGGVSLQVPPGQSVALLSRTASAATDLLDVIAGLRRLRSGHVSVGEVAVSRLSGAELDRYRAGRGLLSARFPLLPSLSVTDNVLAALLSGRVDPVVRERAAQLLAISGAAHLAASPVHRLSAEQQWRILVARALLPLPRLVLAEDPTPGLDSRGATAIVDLLMDAQAWFGFTLLVTTVHVATAVRCQRVVTLADGVVVDDQLVSGDDAWTRGRIDRIG